MFLRYFYEYFPSYLQTFFLKPSKSLKPSRTEQPRPSRSPENSSKSTKLPSTPSESSVKISELSGKSSSDHGGDKGSCVMFLTDLIDLFQSQCFTQGLQRLPASSSSTTSTPSLSDPSLHQHFKKIFHKLLNEMSAIIPEILSNNPNNLNNLGRPDSLTSQGNTDVYCSYLRYCIYLLKLKFSENLNDKDTDIREISTDAPDTSTSSPSNPDKLDNPDNPGKTFQMPWVGWTDTGTVKVTLIILIIQ